MYDYNYIRSGIFKLLNQKIHKDLFYISDIFDKMDYKNFRKEYLFYQDGHPNYKFNKKLSKFILEQLRM